MEQTMNLTQARDEDARASWRPIGGLAGAWADRVAAVRLARSASEPTADLAARLGLAAE